MLGLSPLGVFHTATGLVALLAGFRELARDKEISPNVLLGRIYLASTGLSASTALAIYHHGGFGPAHGVAILALFGLLLGSVCALTDFFGRASRYLQAISYSTTILCHVLPGVTEVLIRFPRGSPMVRLEDASVLKPIYGALLFFFLVGLAFQLRWIRKHPRA